MTGRGEPAGVGFGLLGDGADHITEIVIRDVRGVQPGFDHAAVCAAVGFDEFEGGAGLHDDPVSRARGELVDAEFQEAVPGIFLSLHVTSSFVFFVIRDSSGWGVHARITLQDFIFFP